MSLTFITFGSHGNYIDAGVRLLHQAGHLNIFKETILFTGDSLKEDSEFWDRHEGFVTNNKRGYGYWIWKPYIIKKTMERLVNGDILLYLDCGCEIDVNEKDDLLNSIEIVKRDKIVGTLTCDEHEYNKMDLVKKLKMNNPLYINTSQRQAGIVLYLVCDETRDLVNKWYELACDYHNIDDSPSILKNLPSFKEHRHDQSIFSLLTKKMGIFSKVSLAKRCIKVIRNISNVSKLKPSE